jgi:hypothetical protein
MTNAVNIAQSGSNNVTMRNRIINGAMTIDQRNAGASITPSGSGEAYIVDRWLYETSQGSKFSVQQNAGAVTPPAGFTNYLGTTSLSAYSPISTDYMWIGQRIEGFNIADLGFGTANAQPITLSFWVRSSLTGSFGASLSNAAARVYPFNYTISSANTWEYKTVTIPGDTSGTWATNNTNGMRLQFNIGTGSDRLGTTSAWGSSDFRGGLTGATAVVGTNGATFYITGVQLEEGTAASPFENRLITTELSLCQRYFYMVADGAAKSLGLGTMYTSTQLQGAVFFPVTMRATPTLSATTGSAYYEFIRNGTSDGFNSLSLGNRTSTTVGEIENNSDVSGTVGWSGFIRTDNAATKVGFSAEL